MRALRPKPLLHLEGALVLFLSCILYHQLNGSWLLFVLLLLVPDLFLLGYTINKIVGAACYNLVHTYVLPLSLFYLLWLSGHQSQCWLILIWTAHIGLDRLLGYGLKYPSGFRDTHLNKV
jgi:uncharacterized protein DUF4260